MRTEFDIKNILLSVGIPAIPFPMPLFEQRMTEAQEFPQTLEKVSQKRANQSGRGETALWGENLLGQPVFMPVWMAKGDDFEIELQNPLVVITGNKSLVETNLVGQNGTVKEFINTQDYQIRIVSTIVNKDGTYPETKFYEYIKLIKRNEVLTMKCALTDLFLQAKDNVVVTGFNVPDMQGIVNAQVIEISLKSDWYYELELK